MSNGIDILKQRLQNLQVTHDALAKGATIAAVGAVGIAVTIHSPDKVLEFGALAIAGDLGRQDIAHRIKNIENYLTHHH